MYQLYGNRALIQPRNSRAGRQSAKPGARKKIEGANDPYLSLWIDRSRRGSNETLNNGQISQEFDTLTMKKSGVKVGSPHNITVSRTNSKKILLIEKEQKGGNLKGEPQINTHHNELIFYQPTQMLNEEIIEDAEDEKYETKNLCASKSSPHLTKLGNIQQKSIKNSQVMKQIRPPSSRQNRGQFRMSNQFGSQEINQGKWASNKDLHEDFKGND